ncbi:MAG: nucleotidyltransferase domain-containing protein [Candidatus Omnitrophica bacterium]|nr:nucleotidyltransferase domain-containing protein [Candidatus Omnitrophota bacterium]
MDDKEIEDKLNRYVTKLKNFFDLKMVVLYGSYAKGSGGEDSDIDVAVFIKEEKGADYLEKEKLLYKLSADIDKRIEADLFYIDEIKGLEKASFVQEILKKGKIFYNKVEL